MGFKYLSIRVLFCPANILIDQGLDPDDEAIRAAFFDDPTFNDGTYNLPPEARWSTIINTPAPQLNTALDTALDILDKDKRLKGCFVKHWTGLPDSCWLTVRWVTVTRWKFVGNSSKMTRWKRSSSCRVRC